MWNVIDPAVLPSSLADSIQRTSDSHSISWEWEQLLHKYPEPQSTI